MKKFDQNKLVAGRSISEILKRFDKKIKDPRSFADGKKIVKIVKTFLKINCKLSKLDDELLNFAKKNNLGLINAGVTSFSPSLMQLQYEILEKDFNIKPNIVVAYFDQTDFGDELCRYKDKRTYERKNK